MQNPYLSLDQQMVGDIYTSREVMDNLTVLCDDFGARFSGTPEERQAAEFICDRFQRYGLQGARLESYPYAGWSRGGAKLKISSPIDRSIPCISLPYCPAASVKAELISIGFGAPDDFGRLSSQIEGKIVLASSASSPDLGRWATSRARRLSMLNRLVPTTTQASWSSKMVCRYTWRQAEGRLNPLTREMG